MKFMLIGIDASRAFARNRTGIEEYSFQVIKSLKKELADQAVVLYVRKNQIADFQDQNRDFEIPENWRVKEIKWRAFWTQLGLSLEMLFHPVDVLFVPAHVIPFFHPLRSVVVIHGLEYEFCPRAYSFWEKAYMRFSIKNSCRWAKKIVAVSENTKKDLIKLYKVPEEKIKVIYEGYEKNSPGAERDDRAIRQPQLLFIGRLEERKNILGIVKAFEILKEKYQIPHRLILAGKPGYGYDDLKREIQNSNFKNDISEIGYVSEKEKRELYENTEVFLFPSFYEGFGLPVLEAQNAGTPVVSSDISSIPEVAGSGALLVNPEKPEEIAAAVWSLLNDEKLKEKITREGKENVKRFSWEKCAKEIAGILLKNCY